MNIPADTRLAVRPEDPCTIVIFGASGDLTSRKLVPALYNLYVNDGLPEPVVIVGCSRTQMTQQQFRDSLKSALVAAGNADLSRWEDFAARLHYKDVVYDSSPSFKDLAASLHRLDRQFHTRGNRIFYLAVPPLLYPKIAEMIGQAGLSREGENGNGWARIVVEKPFGRDLKTALQLDQILHGSFKEKQIFRIDHYLAKETVQNILVLRFANSIFEPIWNRRYIDYIRITAAETLGVEHRAGYYEQAGVIRDMFQNHMMQLLALTAMEPPSIFEADWVRDERVKVFRALRPFPVDRLDENIVLGQYGPGIIDGKEVPGYRQEPGVDPESMTPTFARMKVFIDNWRWQGVPFFLTSGKRLSKKLTEIIIQFKEVPHSMFRTLLGEDITANRLTLGIQPDEVINLTFQTKQPGAKVCLQSVTMHFDYQQEYKGPFLDAYEKVLLDCMQGDHILFWRQDGIELSWFFLTPILEQCEICLGRMIQLHPYKAGSWGPKAAQELMGAIGVTE
ncbi:MAG: glucose-6-phosphate dehydrogenase [Deltaproteobacteria bacterium]|nr:glucose-6-phosphate dehydrogenase [Deltaproteobacteria bacterium]MBW2309041.1 glucose-6-phosphate dehydrogenase [Deltaproteobacteria bacterium]